MMNESGITPSLGQFNPLRILHWWSLSSFQVSKKVRWAKRKHKVRNCTNKLVTIRILKEIGVAVKREKLLMWKHCEFEVSNSNTVGQHNYFTKIFHPQKVYFVDCFGDDFGDHIYEYFGDPLWLKCLKWSPKWHFGDEFRDDPWSDLRIRTTKLP